MKALNLIDLAGQSFILGWMLLAQIFGAMTFQFDIVGAAFVYAAMFIGPWQMVSSVITNAAGWVFRKQRLIHLVAASIYLTGWLCFRELGLDKLADELIIALGFGIPAVLAILYYVITLKTFLHLGTYKSVKHFFVKYFHNFLKI